LKTTIEDERGLLVTTTDTHCELDDQLATAILEAATPSDRAMVIRRIVDRLAAVVEADPDAADQERDSLLFLLDAADEHCWRLGAFASRYLQGAADHSTGPQPA
jgi:hypothetical protein